MFALALLPPRHSMVGYIKEANKSQKIINNMGRIDSRVLRFIPTITLTVHRCSRILE